jgi:hypothetical protein
MAISAPENAPSVISVIRTLPESEQTYTKREWADIVKSMKLKPKKYKTVKQGKSKKKKEFFLKMNFFHQTRMLARLAQP